MRQRSANSAKFAERYLILRFQVSEYWTPTPALSHNSFSPMACPDETLLFKIEPVC
jgi:hypothetical protein